MSKLSKNSLLAFLVLLIVVLAGFTFFDDLTTPTANVYIENNTVTCDITPFYLDNKNLEEEICNYVLGELNNYGSDVDSVKKGINDLANSYGINKININLDSEVGKNTLSMVFHVQGTSMNPTLKDGQSIVVEKTKNIHVGDIVVADSSSYGVIVKRVSQIDNQQAYLTSDNKNINYEKVNGIVYQSKGITTWVDISDIYGVVKSY